MYEAVLGDFIVQAIVIFAKLETKLVIVTFTQGVEQRVCITSDLDIAWYYQEEKFC